MNTLDEYQQRAACSYLDEPMMILAGPGSGKTATLASRVIEMVVSANIDGAHICVFTFSNKAAKEMKERIQKYSQSYPSHIPSLSRVLVTTFHSFGYTIIRNALPASTDLTIISDSQIYSMVVECKRFYDQMMKSKSSGDMDLIYARLDEEISEIFSYDYDDEERANKKRKKKAKGKEGDKKDDGEKKDDDGGKEEKEKETGKGKTKKKGKGKKGVLKLKQGKKGEGGHIVLDDDDDDDDQKDPKDKESEELKFRKRVKVLVRWLHMAQVKGKRPNEYIEEERWIFALYEALKKKYNLIDFNDMLSKPLEILNDPNVAARYTDRCRNVLVDEYQDTNKVQFDLVHKLVSGHRRISVVGDGNQSIYEWRGASNDNWGYLETHFSGCHRVLLAKNYRSCEQVIDACGQVLEAIRKHDEDKAATLQQKGTSSSSSSTPASYTYSTISRKYSSPSSSVISSSSSSVPLDPMKAGQVTIAQFPTDRHQDAWVCQQYRDLISSSSSPLSTLSPSSSSSSSSQSVAILVRAKMSLIHLEAQLIHMGIKYAIQGGKSILERKQNKIIMAYLKCLMNPCDLASFFFIINEPSRKLGPASIEKIKKKIKPGSSFLSLKGSNYKIGSLSSVQACSLSSLLSSFEAWGTLLDKPGAPSQLIQRIIDDTKIERKEGKDGNDPVACLMKFIDEARPDEETGDDNNNYDNHDSTMTEALPFEERWSCRDRLRMFLLQSSMDEDSIVSSSSTSTSTPTPTPTPSSSSSSSSSTSITSSSSPSPSSSSSSPSEPCLILSTIHKAKGLEWDTVYVIDVNKDILPKKERAE